MGYFNTQIITDEGLAMMSRGIAGQSQIIFTKMKTGDGEYSVKEIAVLKEAASLKDEKQSFGISSIKTDQETIRIKATISNKNLNEPYYIKEIGVYAKENGGEEKLVAISICQDNPTLLQKFDTMPIEIPITNYIAHSGDGNFNIVYSSNVYATAEELHEYEENAAQEMAELDDKKLNKDDISDWAKQPEKPSYTKEEIGLGNVENTADKDKPVSTAVQAALDLIYANANQFTLNKIAELINGAPETLNTLKEIADAIAANKSIVESLDAAIGKKANQTEFDSHTGNKSNPHSVTKAQIGLGNVENKTSATIRSELTKANVTTALGYTPPTTNTTYAQATASMLGLVKLYTDTGESTDGTMTRKAITQEIDTLLKMINENETWIGSKKSWKLAYSGVMSNQGSGFNVGQYMSTHPNITEFNIICEAIASSGTRYVYTYILSITAYNDFVGSGGTTTIIQGYSASGFTGRCEIAIAKPYIKLNALYVGNTSYTGSQAIMKIYAK